MQESEAGPGDQAEDTESEGESVAAVAARCTGRTRQKNTQSRDLLEAYLERKEASDGTQNISVIPIMSTCLNIPELVSGIFRSQVI
ncbi:hypothetical protein SKAU_G00087680 [Synaphobranchus kaupii]|uniref:Uncharacterized protein n=1 Tax=Synaphobranchus kaupii TaxID=118154 RepID=A0A9Q1FWX4_SYNKA|nr:hypothetical protein SKAU_G00087680 [Synaphobranchus kaupii]